MPKTTKHDNSGRAFIDIPVTEIDDFANYPYRIKDDEAMTELAWSIWEHGLQQPVSVRRKADGRYEMLSGHRRRRACELAGIPAVSAEVCDLDDDAATIFMVQSNKQRAGVLPSEKAFAYKLEYEAMKRQGKRTDLTSVPTEQKLGAKTSLDVLGEKVGESQAQIRRYLRLTELIKQLLDIVDEGRMKLRSAVELSYLSEAKQREVLKAIETHNCTPSHPQAIRLKKLYLDNELTADVIDSIMREEKPNQREKVVLRGERVRGLIPRDIPLAEAEEYICSALEYYVARRGNVA